MEGNVQLTVLLLYIRKLAASATTAGRRSFWADWLRLLPPLKQCTAPVGVWSDQELQLLHYTPLKVCCSNGRLPSCCMDSPSSLHMTPLHSVTGMPTLWHYFASQSTSHQPLAMAWRPVSMAGICTKQPDPDSTHY